jgi:NADP-dependent 3-hydroxy acid dehydrogenase YdfG
MPSSKRVALITGCSSGIGRATALHLAKDGWTVFATARSVTTLADLAQAGCKTMALDVTDEASMARAVAEVEKDHGAVDALINNAGYSQSGAIESVPIDRVRAQFETNVMGLSRMIQLVLPGMRRQRRGRIVNISSMGGKLTFPGGGYYHATKHAVEAISDALRFEVHGFGIDVIVIEPGLIRTSFTAAVSAALAAVEDHSAYAHFHAEVDRITTESYVKGPAAKLAGTAEDVANVISRALAAPRPRTRYRVSPSATVLLTVRHLLSDRLWDGFLRRTYPTPK